MATRGSWGADVFKPVGTNYPSLERVQNRYFAGFDDTADETAEITDVAPVGLVGPITVTINGFMASATTGTIVLEASLEAVTPGDALDLDAAESFDTINFLQSATVPATAGHMFATTITMTNADSIAAGDTFRLRISRDANGTNGTDSAVGDFRLYSVELKDAA